jgi:hydrogenase expression/formation protein HypE
MLHGAGGVHMHSLIHNYITKYFGYSGEAEVPLDALDDAAVVNDIVFKSDSHAVKPIFFPGGDIGRLAVAGTVNDIAALGAEPFSIVDWFLYEG